MGGRKMKATNEKEIVYRPKRKSTKNGLDLNFSWDFLVSFAFFPFFFYT